MTLLFWILLSVQITLGAFDTLYHHELKERLAWRQTQRTELKLHGIRNIFYAVVFVCLGTAQALGLWAWGILAILAIEVLITLKDFVEEDKSRDLPATERVTHTLMALNYGAILMCIVPVLLTWAAHTTALNLVNYGWWTVMSTSAALAVAVFAVRDIMAAKRLERLEKLASTDNVIPYRTGRGRVLITGGTGFIGRALVPALQSAGYSVSVLTRYTANAKHLAAPIQLLTDLNQIKSDERFDAVINLAGEPIAKGLWTRKRLHNIYASRIRMTRKLYNLIKRLNHKPGRLINGSAIGVYGIAQPDPVGELAPIVKDNSFGQRLCLAWEREAKTIEAMGVRTILLRIGIVLDADGGPLGAQLVPTELGGGVVMGDGRHHVSWISRSDLVRLIGHCLEAPNLSGPVNATAPQTVTNRQFTRAMAKGLTRPVWLRIPKLVIVRGLGGLGKEILLADQNIRPDAATYSGFIFKDADLESYLKRILSGHKPPSPSDLPHKNRIAAPFENDTVTLCS